MGVNTKCGVLCLGYKSCADPEHFVRGGPTLTASSIF